jgi:hypothetical protein
MKTFFGPLDKEYCLYFYYLSILFAIVFVLIAFGVFISVFKGYKKMDFKIALNLLMLLINSFLIYFVNRLLYSMCIKSLN